MRFTGVGSQKQKYCGGQGFRIIGFRVEILLQCEYCISTSYYISYILLCIIQLLPPSFVHSPALPASKTM